MYGEKVEEAEEMRMDLQDIKKMYKDQVCVYNCYSLELEDKPNFSFIK